MASAEYIAAAEAENREPVVFMRVDGSNEPEQYYTTKADWDGSDNLTNVDTQTETGSVISQFRQVAFANTYLATGWPYHIREMQASTLLYTAFGSQLYDIPPPVGTTVNISFNHSYLVTLNDGSNIFSTTIKFYNATIQGTVTSVAGDTITWSGAGYKAVPSPMPSFYFATGATINITSSIGAGGTTATIPGYGSAGVLGASVTVASLPDAIAVPSGFANCNLTTSAIDMGAVPTGTPILSTDDITEPGCVISYQFQHSNDDITYTDGGYFVGDGVALTPARYYKIIAAFRSTNGNISTLREIRISQGAFRYFGTHIDQPFPGILPHIVPNSVSTLNQKIKLGKGLSTTGESNVQLYWLDSISDMISSGYLRGKDVTVFSGFVGLPEDKYEQIITGTWYDHQMDDKTSIINVKIRDALKQFQKRKIPEEEVNNLNGAISNSTLTYTTLNLMTVILDLFDKINLRDRYISDDFATLEAGQYSAAKYKVSRVIDEPKELSELIDQLAVTGSMYIIPLGNGQLKPKPFDINQAAIATLDADALDFGGLKGNLSTFFSRFYAYYNQKTTLTDDPSTSKDFDNGYALIDGTAEVKWYPEKATKQHLDLWKVGRSAAATPLTVPPQALIDLVNLWHVMFTEPLITVDVKNLPPRYANIEPADVVLVDNLKMPVVNTPWGGSAFYNGKSLDISAQDATPSGVTFHPGGLIMYTTGDVNSKVYQYELTTAWDATTATYNGVFVDVSTDSLIPKTVFFKPDGTKMYILTRGYDRVTQYSLSTAWDVSTATYDSLSKSVATEDVFPWSVFFRFDGLKMYVSGTQNSGIYQYSLSTAWDVSTASYDSVSFTTGPSLASPVEVFFDTDGIRMYVLNAINNQIAQYRLTTAWDVSTAVYTGAFLSVESTDNVSIGFTFKPDGHGLYVIGRQTDSVYSYALTSAWDMVGKIYVEGDRVIHDGEEWRSRVGDNTNNDPTSEPAFWQDLNIDDTGYSNSKRFFVIGRTFNPNDATMSLNLMEMPPATLGAFSSAFSSAFDV